VFGPSSLAARMEGSKAFSKDFMARHSIPTAAFKVFTSQQYSEALEYSQTCGHRVVLKASGLAAGKGVLIPETPEEVEKGLKDILLDQVFGVAGKSRFSDQFCALTVLRRMQETRWSSKSI
jgi:phosphoribosylamine--glycine ligase / phosphoribosylformylglycinamidine cyclo-ligase